MTMVAVGFAATARGIQRSLFRSMVASKKSQVATMEAIFDDIAAALKAPPIALAGSLRALALRLAESHERGMKARRQINKNSSEQVMLGKVILKEKPAEARAGSTGKPRRHWWASERSRS
ncbi:hypothetical protein LB523_19235 [Mesorhizobium sp. ESP-6-4]|uniref:hypothetical protein n=2 Tax=unclassified Mesorhizobium TaxID=325217 RepID=UPI001CCB0298|nr:hypothetical protein [Mesorhizobium sp. ESP-6-4]MBZ9661182.1 hypothetical protein [Mesorhizobium sp. ESP-6-4]